MTPWWITVAVVVITWLISAAMTYGIVITRLKVLEEGQQKLANRIDLVESRHMTLMATTLTRDEYLMWQKKLEEKVDRNQEYTSRKLDDLRDLLISMVKGS